MRLRLSRTVSDALSVGACTPGSISATSSAASTAAAPQAARLLRSKGRFISLTASSTYSATFAHAGSDSPKYA